MVAREKREDESGALEGRPEESSASEGNTGAQGQLALAGPGASAH